MDELLMRTVTHATTFLTRHEVFAYRDEALENWKLPGGIEAVQATLLARLRTALDYARSSNAYYAGLFASAGFDPLAMTDLKGISVLPIMTKDDIRRHRCDFDACESRHPHRVETHTSGSTGQPLKFSMSREDHLRSVGVRLAGWHLAGYVLGDRAAVFGGAWTGNRDGGPWRSSVADLVLNRRQFKVSTMEGDLVARYWDYIARWRPAYLRGSPTALAEFCRHRPRDRGGHYRPRAVLTTSEVLTKLDRHIIEERLEAPVFDAWGLNDGGASAFECDQHAGLHIDTTRAYVETVDDEGHPIWGIPGRIVVTSLTNTAFPFVRYETGDMGVLTWRTCACGRSGLMLTRILGRCNDMLDIGGIRMRANDGSWLTDIGHMRRWRLVQDGPQHITATFDVEAGFNRKVSEEALVRAFTSHCPAASITFVYAPLPLPSDGSKWKSVIVLDSARHPTGLEGRA